MIEKLYMNGQTPVNSIKAVTKDCCNRCLGNNVYKDNYGKYHCLDCFQYGEINDSMTLYRFKRDLKETIHSLQMEYTLSDLQVEGSKFLLDCFKHNESGFLQAVCGAGKTEMTYQTILHALNSQKKVCFVIPRVEVIKEIAARLKQAFTKTKISVLYQGNKLYEESELFVSTPQQLIYFYQEFDLIILDEVDAFPYSGSKFLERLVKKSLKPKGIMLYMSATVSQDFTPVLQNMKTHLIPSRYHMKPMVIPQFVKIKNLSSLNKKLLPLLNTNKLEKKRTLLFVPTISAGYQFNDLLKEKGYKVAFVSSRTKYKDIPINQFKNSEISILITTTILERGVTFSNIDVFVLCSDHKVFNKETLIQISGRVGRDIDYPEGKLIFFSEYLTHAMKMTKSEIIYMNCRNSGLEM